MPADFSPLGYVYLASPYSHPYPTVVNQRVILAHEATIWLIRRGFVVHSPIVHCDLLTRLFKLGSDAKSWESQNRIMLRDAKEGLIVLQLDGWRDSQGVNMEIEWALADAQPIREMVRTTEFRKGETDWMLMSVLGDPRGSHSHGKGETSSAGRDLQCR